MSAKKNTKANGDASKTKKTKSVDKSNPEATPTPAKDETQQQRVSPDQQIGFHNHYIKDLSFENPNAPTIYSPARPHPKSP